MKSDSDRAVYDLKTDKSQTKQNVEKKPIGFLDQYAQFNLPFKAEELFCAQRSCCKIYIYMELLMRVYNFQQYDKFSLDNCKWL